MQHPRNARQGVLAAQGPTWPGLDQAPLGAALVSLEGHVERANAELGRIAGRPRVELEKRRVADLLDAADAAQWETELDALCHQRKIIVSAEQRWTQPGGQTVWSRTLGWLVRDQSGAPGRVLLLVVELSRSLAAEARARRRAEEARLGQMAAVLAHEIKNPIAGIGGALRLVAKGFPPRSAERGVLDESVQRLLSLDAVIENLLEFARPVSPVTVPVPVGALLESVDQYTREDPRLRGVRVRRSGPDIAIRGDPELLGRALRCLLLNSAQAMHGGGDVRIQVEERDQRCVLVVSDSGPGIPAELGDLVFEPFFTTRSTALGLGLSLVRRIVEAHGGEIRIDSSAPNGARVVVSLPLARPATEPAGTLASP